MGTRKSKSRRPTWPSWSHRTKREWRQDVRKRYAAVQLAMEHLRQGCAYYPEPAFLKLKAAHKMLDEIGQMLSPSKWGR